ncbi:MAG: hypothetical protein HGA67_01590 [Candidatus Yonathbacteria bacterium]|nr:hypothetical protein [Candidatus Yonathbacteria bacterium]
MKTLIIINGVTGAIGSACLARFSREHDTTIIGLSRQARDMADFLNDKHLPDATFACSIGDITQKESCERFTKSLDVSRYEQIIYIHAVGIYPIEIDTSGDVGVSHDTDDDGIDDRVLHLSYDAFFAMSDSLQKTNIPVYALLFGGVADKFKPSVHTSWWTVMEKIKHRMKETSKNSSGISYFVLNISSVISSAELLNRPFVFTKTDAEPAFWLMPHEIAERVATLVFSKKIGFTEDEIYHRAKYYRNNHFDEDKFIVRRKKELGIS